MKVFKVSSLILAGLGLSLMVGCRNGVSHNHSSDNSSHQTTHGDDSHGDDSHHGSHSHGDNHGGASTQAELVVPPELTPSEPFDLAIEISDASGEPISDFEITHEKLLHLIVVSDNFEVYRHLHPEYKGNGRFELNASLPEAGNYTLFADYKPQDKSGRVSQMTLSIPGGLDEPAAENFDRTKVYDNTQVQLNFDPNELKAGGDILLQYALTDTTTQKAADDLEPYLGALGHLVILRQTDDITTEDYIHAHPMNGKTPGEVSFHTQFPQPGRYKLWGEFNRNGNLVVSEFWVEVPESGDTE